jgi:hypothetical protein
MSNAIEILITFLTLSLKVINIPTAIIKIAIFEMNNFLTRQSLDYTPGLEFVCRLLFGDFRSFAVLGMTNRNKQTYCTKEFCFFKTHKLQSLQSL